MSARISRQAPADGRTLRFLVALLAATAAHATTDLRFPSADQHDYETENLSKPQKVTKPPEVFTLQWDTDRKTWARINRTLDAPAGIKRNSIPTRKMYHRGLCGNGVVDAGEECDCGGPDNCSLSSKACCDANYCILVPHAECDGKGACCTRECLLKRGREVCRPAKNSCDIREVCSGLSDVCPPDAFRKNGEICAEGQDGYCINRHCATRDEQCMETWGLHSYSAAEDCYTQFNTKGIFNGNCGLSADDLTLRPCAVEDIFCGTLQCRSGGYIPLSSSFAQSFTTTILTNATGRLVQCKTKSPEVINQMSIQTNLVRDGTKCAPNKICLKNRCVAMSASLSIRPDNCPSRNRTLPCSGHGVCSDLNTCSCEDDYSGSDCSKHDPVPRRHSSPKNSLLNLRRSTFNATHHKKNQNEVVDNNSIQVVVIIMSAIILGAMIAIMSSACCGREARRLETQNKALFPSSADTPPEDEMV